MTKYVLDYTHNNLLADSNYGGRVVAQETKELNLDEAGALLLQHPNIDQYGTVFWEISWN